MAPSRSRHLLVWTTLPIAIILSYLWFRRKRNQVQSDPGKTDAKQLKTLKEELEEAETSKSRTCEQSPSRRRTDESPKQFSRSLSSPIDIILPPELKSQKSSQLVISDEDLDLEIQKIRSMKTSSSDQYLRRKDTTPSSQLSSPSKSSAKNETANTTPIKKSLEGAPTPPAPPPPLLTLPPPAQTSSPKKKTATTTTTNSSPKLQVIPKKTNKTSKMLQKESKSDKKLSTIEKKIDSLKLTDTHLPKRAQNGLVDLPRQSTERDSANHSPADVMLASPSLSSISDSHSEGSNDSGKGCSEVATPPLRTSAGDGSVNSEINLPTVYEFVIPQTLVGRLIGRQGTFVTYINEKTNANILIKKHPESTKFKVCAVEGTASEIEKALDLIREKFPEKRYSELSLEQVSFAPPISTVSLAPELLCLKLVEGINNDTIVSCMVAPNHLFLQQPTHPTFPNLNFLSNFMNTCYSDSNSPLLPNPIPPNTVCAAYSLGAWYRAIVLSTDTDADTSYLKFLDYGGYATTPNSELRQIRADFLLLPFQASECFLANIQPIGGDESTWPEQAFDLVAELTKGSVVYTQVAEYTEDGIPLVLIYVIIGPQIIYLNGELVNRGYAEWTTSEEEGAVGGAPKAVVAAAAAATSSA